MKHFLKNKLLYGITGLLIIVAFFVIVKNEAKAQFIVSPLFNQQDLHRYLDFEDSGTTQYDPFYSNVNDESKTCSGSMAYQQPGKFDNTLFWNNWLHTDANGCTTQGAYHNPSYTGDGEGETFAFHLMASNTPASYPQKTSYTLLALHKIGEPTTNWATQANLHLTASGTLAFAYRTSNNDYAWWTSDDEVWTFDENWKHITVQYLYYNVSDTFNLYLNNVAVSGTWNGNETNNYDHTSGDMYLALGRSTFTSFYQGLEGQMDDFAWFNRWITLDERTFIQTNRINDNYIPYDDVFVEYMKDLSAYIHYADYNFIDADQVKTKYYPDIEFSMSVPIKYDIWAPDTFAVDIDTSIDGGSTWTDYDEGEVGDFQYSLTEDPNDYWFTPFGISSTSPTTYFLARIFDLDGFWRDTEVFKFVFDPNELYNTNIASNTPEWQYTYDIESACDDVATSTGTFDDFRYGIECGFRKVLYWGIQPREDTMSKLMNGMGELQNEFPFNIYNGIKNSFEHSKDTASTTYSIPFMPTTEYINLEGDFFDTGMMYDTWGSTWTTIYNSIEIIIYTFVAYYIIMRILRVRKNI